MLLGITANLVAPATVEGTEGDRAIDSRADAVLAAATPMGRLVRPDDVAKTVAFLASDDSGCTTGHYIPVSGGLGME